MAFVGTNQGKRRLCSIDRKRNRLAALDGIGPETRIDNERIVKTVKRFRKWDRIQWRTGGTRSRGGSGRMVRARFHAFIVHYIFIAGSGRVTDTPRISSVVYAAEHQTARFHLPVALFKLSRINSTETTSSSAGKIHTRRAIPLELEENRTGKGTAKLHRATKVPRF